jgi:2-polyprenyl-3-methyl-5-hydroxy-6-metoxy-1,4-benzoquinol methylase
MQDPDGILKPHINEGMSVLDVGCGMGFFSLPMAKLVGDKGRVVCIDLQEKMIQGLVSRAKKAGLDQRLDARVCSQSSLGLHDLSGKIDFALAFALVHEVPQKDNLFSEIHDAIKPDGRLLLAEPRGHVSKQDFEKTVSVAQSRGFEPAGTLDIRRSHAVLLRAIEKQATAV